MSSDVPSPCVSRCMLDQNEICEGCFRSVKEIRMWYKWNYAKKLKALENIAERKKKYGLADNQ